MTKISTLAFVAALGLALPVYAQTSAPVTPESPTGIIKADHEKLHADKKEVIADSKVVHAEKKELVEDVKTRNEAAKAGDSQTAKAVEAKVKEDKTTLHQAVKERKADVKELKADHKKLHADKKERREETKVQPTPAQ